MPQLSLVCPSNREGAWIEHAISTVVTDLDFEVICVTPSPEPISSDPRIKHVFATTRLTQCMEIGVWKATSEVFGFMADDQTFSPYAWDEAYEIYKKANDRKAIVSLNWYENGENYRYRRVRGGVQIPGSDAIVNRQFYFEVGGMSQRFHSSEADSDMFLRAIRSGATILFGSGSLTEYQGNHPHFPGRHTNSQQNRVPEDYMLLNEWVCQNGQIISGPVNIPFDHSDSIYTVNQYNPNIPSPPKPMPLPPIVPSAPIPCIG